MRRVPEATPAPLPRYARHVRLPPYRYVPGAAPHPLRHPLGHLRNSTASPRSAAAALLHGVDLFNREFYWEAHEVWEERWHDATGNERVLLQSLIQLAAGYLKIVQFGPCALARELFARALARSEELTTRREMEPTAPHIRRSELMRALARAMEDATSTTRPTRPRLTIEKRSRQTGRVPLRRRSK